MIPTSLMTLAVSFFAVYFWVNSTEEIVKVGAAGIALICLFLSIVFAPWAVLLMLVVPLVRSKVSSANL
jgi:predicted exporter